MVTTKDVVSSNIDRLSSRRPLTGELARFGDFDSRGYLRNFFGSKDIPKVKALEDGSF
jgi:hypothetical protein